MEATEMTKEQAIRWAGNGMKLAELLGITPQAVYLWIDGEPIPKLRQYQIDDIKRRKRSTNGVAA
jgi:DNA-binding transcriptional regulator YdaS (Cro superfamily)